MKQNSTESFSNLSQIGASVSSNEIVGSTNSQSNLAKFAEFCGITADGTRKYGDLEKSGKVINFFLNRFFKNINSYGTQDLTSSTREAFFSAYDHKATSEPRDEAVSKNLPEGKETEFRAKRIKYGNYNAMWEVLSAHLYRLTGLNAPDNRMMIVDSIKESEIPDVYVASPLISGYYDLGNFLLDRKIIGSFLRKEDLSKWEEQSQIIEAINNKATLISETANQEEKKSEAIISDQDKIARVEALNEIYRLLPKYVHDEIEKSFIASKFTANWDFANFNLNNIGVRFTFNRDREVIGFESVFVDHGNQGDIGFGGRKKENSLERANSEAKKQQDKPKDFDPSLSFTSEEMNLIQYKLQEAQKSGLIKSEIDQITRPIELIYQDLAEHEVGLLKLSEEQIQQRRSIVFKDSHHIFSQESSLSLNNINRATTGLLSFSDVPRNLPFFQLFEAALKEKNNKISQALDPIISSPTKNQKTQISQSLTDLFSSPDFYRESELEMCFRLSLISDETIERTCKNWYLFEEFPEIFTPKIPQDLPIKSHEEIAQIFKERRDLLVQSIPKEVVDQWVKKNPLTALSAQREVALASCKEQFEIEEDFEEKYPFVIGEGESKTAEETTIPKSFSFISVYSAASLKISSPNRNSSAANLNSASISEENSERSSPVNFSFIASAINQENSFENRLNSQERVEATYKIGAIFTEISQQEFEVQEKYQPQLDAVNNKISDLLTSELPADLKSDLSSHLEVRKFEIEAKILCEKVEFLSKKLQDWRKQLGLNSQPNNKFLEIAQIRELYRCETRPNDLTIPSNALLFSQESQSRNKILNDENQFIFNYFVEHLKELTIGLVQNKNFVEPENPSNRPQNPSMPTPLRRTISENSIISGL